MSVLWQAWAYAYNHQDRFWRNAEIHGQLSVFALLIAAVVAITTGILLTRRRRAASAVINVASLGRTIPSLAILTLLLPILGTGFRPALVALVLIAIPPILINTYVGLTGVDPGVIEAARGMGMEDWERLRRVELPLAVPVIFAGMRTSAVQVVASATLATFIGGGGLGDFIQAGISLNDFGQILVGAVPVAAGALFTDWGVGALERALTPRGLRA